jgi:hypothetical protein
MFHEKGLGGIVSSWIGTGQNLPISADQLQNVLHSGALQQAAQSAGIDPRQLTASPSTLCVFTKLDNPLFAKSKPQQRKHIAPWALSPPGSGPVAGLRSVADRCVVSANDTGY